MSDQASRGLLPWEALSADEQLRLREDYGRYLDGLPPTCDLRTKQQQFQDWVAEQGVDWQP